MREVEGVFVAEGVHLALEALKTGATIEAAVVSSRLSTNEEGRDLVRRLHATGIKVHDSSDATLDAALQALLLDETVPTPGIARAILDEMIELQGELLPPFRRAR